MDTWNERTACELSGHRFRCGEQFCLCCDDCGDSYEDQEAWEDCRERELADERSGLLGDGGLT